MALNSPASASFSEPRRERWGDDDSKDLWSDRSPYSDYDYTAEGLPPLSFSNSYDFNSYYGHFQQRCATPVHRGFGSPARRGGAVVRRRGPQACLRCGCAGRSVRACSEEACDAAACDACRLDSDGGWSDCDVCGHVYCEACLVPVSFTPRLCCGLYLLTANQYHLCTPCGDYWERLLPSEADDDSDEAHGIAACDFCHRATCVHATYCRHCGHRTAAQAAMAAARRGRTAIPLDLVAELKRFSNSCLARDVAASYIHTFAQQIRLQMQIQTLPLARRAGARRVGSVKQARATRHDAL